MRGSSEFRRRRQLSREANRCKNSYCSLFQLMILYKGNFEKVISLLSGACQNDEATSVLGNEILLSLYARFITHNLVEFSVHVINEFLLGLQICRNIVLLLPCIYFVGIQYFFGQLTVKRSYNSFFAHGRKPSFYKTPARRISPVRCNLAQYSKMLFRQVRWVQPCQVQAVPVLHSCLAQSNPLQSCQIQADLIPCDPASPVSSARPIR